MESKKALILLHKKGLIEWSGFNSAVKSIEKKTASKEVVEWVEFTVGRLEPNDYS